MLLTSKQNSSRMPSWHPPDSESGMVQDDESTIKVHNDTNVCFFRIPLDYPPEYLGSPGETKYPNYSPNSETEPDTDLKNQEPEIRKANDNDIVGPINQIISGTLRLR